MVGKDNEIRVARAVRMWLGGLQGKHAPLLCGAVLDVFLAKRGLDLDRGKHALHRKEKLGGLSKRRGLVGLIEDDQVRLPAVAIVSIDQEARANPQPPRDEGAQYPP